MIPNPFTTRRHRALILAFVLFLSGVACQSPALIHHHTLTEPLRLKTRLVQKIETLRSPPPSDEGAIIIERDNTILDLGGGELQGADFNTPPENLTGRAIVIRGAKNVTIRNTKIKGFKVAIYAEDAPNLLIENCDVSGNFRQRLQSTPFQESSADWLWPHKNDNNEWLQYGSGIYLLRCDGAKLKNNRARQGQIGICLAKCRDVTVELNDMSYLSGWGLALWRSTKCRILGNRFDYCVRGFSAGRYARGQDSAGILMFEQCSDNIIAFNSATHGGDGLFIYGGDETLKITGEGGCNRNFVYQNDFSHAVMNGIEATFSDDNVFVTNRLVDCYHGFWGGYCKNFNLTLNEFANCKIGAAIEHARNLTLRENSFDACERGLHLWWDEDQMLAEFAYVKRQGNAAQNANIEWCEFDTCNTGMLIDSVADISLRFVQLNYCETALLAKGNSTFSLLNFLRVFTGKIINESDRPMRGLSATFDGSVLVGGDIRFEKLSINKSTEPASDRIDSSAARRSTENAAARLVLNEENWKWISDWPRRNDFANISLQSLLANRGGSRNDLLIGPYGPVHQEFGWSGHFAWGLFAPDVFTSGNTAIIRCWPPGMDFHFDVLEGKVSVTPKSGTGPCHIEVTPSEPFTGVMPYRLRMIALPYRMNIEGVFVSAEWNTVFHSWTPETDPLQADENWQKILATEPIHRETKNDLNYIWGGGPITKDGPRDRFALVANTKLPLPAGKWRIRTISDDGIRVYRNNNRIIDNWNWHAPKTDIAEFVTTENANHEFRVEYFEIDGHAQLQFFIEMVQEAQDEPTTTMPAEAE